MDNELAAFSSSSILKMPFHCLLDSIVSLKSWLFVSLLFSWDNMSFLWLLLS